MPSTTRYRVISNEINPPEVVSNDSANQSKLRRNKKQQINKSRGNKTLKLTGNVDLGNSVFKQTKQSKRKNTRKLTTPSTTATTTTQHPNTISEIFQPNHHRHNHYENRLETHKAHKPSVTTTTTSTQYPFTYPRTTDSPLTSTTRAYFIESTSSVPAFNTTALAAKLLEKVMTSFLN